MAKRFKEELRHDETTNASSMEFKFGFLVENHMGKLLFQLNFQCRQPKQFHFFHWKQCSLSKKIQAMYFWQQQRFHFQCCTQVKLFLHDAIWHASSLTAHQMITKQNWCELQGLCWKRQFLLAIASATCPCLTSHWTDESSGLSDNENGQMNSSNSLISWMVLAKQKSGCKPSKCDICCRTACVHAQWPTHSCWPTDWISSSSSCHCFSEICIGFRVSWTCTVGAPSCRGFVIGSKTAGQLKLAMSCCWACGTSSMDATESRMSCPGISTGEGCQPFQCTNPMCARLLTSTGFRHTICHCQGLCLGGSQRNGFSFELSFLSKTRLQGIPMHIWLMSRLSGQYSCTGSGRQAAEAACCGFGIFLHDTILSHGPMNRKTNGEWKIMQKTLVALRQHNTQPSWVVLALGDSWSPVWSL